VASALFSAEAITGSATTRAVSGAWARAADRLRRARRLSHRAEALLAGGRAGEAVVAAEALVAAEPLREGAVAILVRGLVAAGRFGDALRAYDRLRDELAEQLGLDPSPQLRALHGQALRHAAPGRPLGTRAPPGRNRRADQLVRRSRRRPGPRRRDAREAAS
jgi:pentatricopeptide repeat protein